MNKKVLVVDDDAAVRRVIRRALEAVGCEVVEIDDGADAADLVDGLRPAVVLLDIHMPRLDGIAVADELSETHPDVAVVMVSGDAGESRERLARERGAVGFLPKPLDLEALRRTVIANLARSSPSA